MMKQAAHNIIMDVFVSQTHMNGAVMLDIMGDFCTAGDTEFTVFVTDPRGRVTELPSFPLGPLLDPACRPPTLFSALPRHPVVPGCPRA